MTAPACRPGTAPAVIHNWRIRPRLFHRCAVECSCQPDRAIAVADWGNWDAVLVLAVHRQHKAACAQRIANAERELAQAAGRPLSYTRSALARKVQEVPAP